MTLLFPIGLAALAGVLVPLLIHLARRTEQRPTDFAALRWLRQKPRPRHRPRFDERLLLVVRLLLLAAVVLVLAQPMLPGAREAEAVIAIAPGATVPPATAARRIWLAPGFPPIEAAPPSGTMQIGSLIRQLDAELPPATRLTVIVPRVLNGADAERPRVSRAVTWRIAGEGRAPSPPRPAVLPTLRFDPAVPGVRYMAAAVRALGSTDIGGPALPIKSSGTVRGGLVWLVAGALPPRIAGHAASGNTVLVASAAIVPAATTIVPWRDGDSTALVEAQPLGRGRILRFTRPLTPATMPQLLEADFPRRLAALLAPPPEPGRVLASAYAPQPGARAPTPPARPLWPWLAVGVAALFLVERWLATRAGRAIAP